MTGRLKRRRDIKPSLAFEGLRECGGGLGVLGSTLLLGHLCVLRKWKT